MSDARFSKPDELWTSEAADRASVTFPRCSGSKERPAKGVHWSFPRRDSFQPTDLDAARAKTLLGDPDASAAVSELDRQARVDTGSTESLVDAGSTAQGVILAPAEELVPSSLAEETICAHGSAKIVQAWPAIDAVVTFARIDLVIATACADDIPPAPGSNEVVSAACDDDIMMLRPTMWSGPVLPVIVAVRP